MRRTCPTIYTKHMPTSTYTVAVSYSYDNVNRLTPYVNYCLRGMWSRSNWYHLWGLNRCLWIVNRLWASHQACLHILFSWIIELYRKYTCTRKYGHTHTAGTPRYAWIHAPVTKITACLHCREIDLARSLSCDPEPACSVPIGHASSWIILLLIYI